jgi:LPPG:FO 2-phospho-L-lactate transferase
VRTVLLAGGTGGARLAAGFQAVIGTDLSVVANTGDDIELMGVHISPDPDLITWWLSGEIDEDRGWGIKDDSFRVFERMSRFGAPDWMSLSDLDLAACLYRREFMAEGGRQTIAQAQIARGVGAVARVLPMSDDPVRTRVMTGGQWKGLQEFLILEGGQPEVEAVEIEGITAASPTPEVLEAIDGAELIVVGPSNPVISIGPILALGGIRQAIAGSRAPVIAVSPYVAGRVVKGPTDNLMRTVGRSTDTRGVLSLYEGLLDALVCDRDDPDPPKDAVRCFTTPTLMDSEESRQALARAVIEVAETVAGDEPGTDR